MDAMPRTVVSRSASFLIICQLTDIIISQLNANISQLTDLICLQKAHKSRLHKIKPLHSAPVV